MRAVTKINVSGAGFISLDKCPCAWPRERVTGLVVLRKIGFILHDDSPASSPNELRADQFARARERIAPKEYSTNDLSLHEARCLPRCGPRQAITTSKTFCFVEDR